MPRPKCIPTFLVIACVTLSTAAQAQDAGPKSPELKVLQRFVGDWHETVTIKPVNAGAKKTVITATSKRRWILDGHMIENKGTWSSQDKSFLHLMTYDSKGKEYRQFYFDRDSRVPQELRGRWNASTKTLSFTGMFSDGIQSTSQQRFLDKNTFTWTLVAKDKSGKVILDVEGKAVRKK